MLVYLPELHCFQDGRQVLGIVHPGHQYVATVILAGLSESGHIFVQPTIDSIDTYVSILSMSLPS